ncbi:hypothetical protein [Aeromonas veronii]|uniref:hypothetical protein n=1 Tax=Aeromonas veronii TaxID=654 RepID=UPI003BA210F8
MKVSLEVVYSILISWAREGSAKTYSDLSHVYHNVTGEWLDPHGSWDRPLGELANIVYSAGGPALTALVVLKGKNEPGGDFWGCAPNVPARPRDEMVRLGEWMRIAKECFAYPWTDTLMFPTE